MKPCPAGKSLNPKTKRCRDTEDTRSLKRANNILNSDTDAKRNANKRAKRAKASCKAGKVKLPGIKAGPRCQLPMGKKETRHQTTHITR